jgi:hypothetical protein
MQQLGTNTPSQEQRRHTRRDARVSVEMINIVDDLPSLGIIEPSTG